MADWQVMAHQVVLPIAADTPVSMPTGWEPFGVGERQGANAVVLCKRLAVAPPGDGPVLDSITPNALAAGGPPETVEVLGSGFDAGCSVYADDTPRATFFLDATHLEYTARPDLATSGQAVAVTVRNDAGSSAALTFTYT